MESDNTWTNIHFSKFCLSQSQDSRREREFCPLNLEVRDENEIFLSISQGSRRDRDIFFQVSCFEMGLRDEISLILMRIFEIEKSRHALGPVSEVCLTDKRKETVWNKEYCPLTQMLGFAFDRHSKEKEKCEIKKIAPSTQMLDPSWATNCLNL